MLIAPSGVDSTKSILIGTDHGAFRLHVPTATSIEIFRFGVPTLAAITSLTEERITPTFECCDDPQDEVTVLQINCSDTSRIHLTITHAPQTECYYELAVL